MMHPHISKSGHGVRNRSLFIRWRILGSIRRHKIPPASIGYSHSGELNTIMDCARYWWSFKGKESGLRAFDMDRDIYLAQASRPRGPRLDWSPPNFPAEVQSTAAGKPPRNGAAL